MADASEWDALIEGLRDGEAEALAGFVHSYGPALERVAAGAIQPGMRRRFGPETIAQSVCRTFMRRAKSGQFEIADGDSLWGLLCAIALNKVREQARFHLRQKRGVDREVQLDAVPGGAQHLRARVARPEEAAIFADELARILGACDERERQMVELRLADHSQTEIAEAVGCTERTVRRVFARLEERLRAGS